MPAGSAESKTARVTIFNQTYTVATAGDPRELEAVALEVDELMRAIATRAGNIDTARVAVLACLHFADELRALKHDLSNLKSRIDSKSREFSLMLDQVIE